MLKVELKIDGPEATTEQQVAFLLLAAMELYQEPRFVEWARRWLDGSDRTLASSDAAHKVAADASVYGVRASVHAAISAAACLSDAPGYADRTADRAIARIVFTASHDAEMLHRCSEKALSGDWT